MNGLGNVVAPRVGLPFANENSAVANFTGQFTATQPCAVPALLANARPLSAGAV